MKGLLIWISHLLGALLEWDTFLGPLGRGKYSLEIVLGMLLVVVALACAKMMWGG